MRDDLSDSHELQSVLRRETLELRPPGHRTIGVEDLTDDTRWGLPGHSGEIDRGFGLTDSLENPAGLRSKREDMSRSSQVLRRCPRVDGNLDRLGPIGGADARGHALLRGGIDRDHECRPVRVGVDVAHRGERQLVRPFGGQG